MGPLVAACEDDLVHETQGHGGVDPEGTAPSEHQDEQCWWFKKKRKYYWYNGYKQSKSRGIRVWATIWAKIQKRNKEDKELDNSDGWSSGHDSPGCSLGHLHLPAVSYHRANIR